MLMQLVALAVKSLTTVLFYSTQCSWISSKKANLAFPLPIWYRTLTLWGLYWIFFLSIRYAYNSWDKRLKIKLFIDFSWVFLNGIVKVFNECSMKKYMASCQEIIVIEGQWSLKKKIGKCGQKGTGHCLRKCMSGIK